MKLQAARRGRANAISSQGDRGGTDAAFAASLCAKPMPRIQVSVVGVVPLPASDCLTARAHLRMCIVLDKLQLRSREFLWNVDTDFALAVP
jgi:hypothetical protein